MKDIPIIFSGPMVRALLDGRKTMTRRLAGTWRKVPDAVQKGNYLTAFCPTPWKSVKPGDRLWVREATAFINNSEFNEPSYTEYRADTNGRCLAGDWPDEEKSNSDRPRWKPSIHMPRAASRLTLLISAVKVERLKDMSPEDAIAEGMKAITKDGNLVKYGLPDRDGLPGTDDYGWPWEDWRISPVDAFERLWTNLHGADAWNDNSEVVALTFTVHKQNIDSLGSPVVSEPSNEAVIVP